MSEFLEHKSWIKRNRIWFIPSLLLLTVILFIIIGSGLGGKVKDVGKAYADTALYDDATVEVKKNKEAIAFLGDIIPTDAFAIAEGYVTYSEDDNEVRTTIRIKGSKGKGKLDIYAERNGSTWNYKEIKIRSKGLEKPIMIIGN